MTKPWRSTDDDTGDHALVCSVCGAAITDERHRVERGGGHEHTFANPHGFVHHVRCFGFAESVAEIGAPETAFSWFPGYAWQILDCARCRVHIGWRFRGGEDFYGLIAERLVAR